MNIKNCTSTVAVERSVSLIEKNLVAVGATHIAKMYGPTGDLIGVIFQINIDGAPLSFRLPARWEKVFDKMWREVRKPRPDTEKRLREQAQRTAWKLLYDQIAVQVSNVLIDQQDAAETFFPYLYDGKRNATIYELAKSTGFKQLTMGSRTETKGE
jgi:hypothetical protein